VRRISGLVVLALVVAAPASAQMKRIELTPFYGYTWSEGVDTDKFTLGGVTYSGIGPKSSVSGGLALGIYTNEQAEIEFQWSFQQSKLTGDGIPKDVDFADMFVHNYHVKFVFNYGYEDFRARPYLFGGLGATQYAPEDIGGVDVEGSTRFSTTWGGGIKILGNLLGARLEGRWTPTYIRTTDSGLYCSPYYPWYCWEAGDSDYSNQWDVTGGLMLRF
jgi:hypothetical protein